MTTRRPFVVGNWKMNTDHASGPELVLAVGRGLGKDADQVEVGVCPPLVYVALVASKLSDARSPIRVGAQNLSSEPSGAFTGEVSAAMLKDVGATFVLVGHSERRHLLGENDAFISRKVRAALAAGLDCILCIGETLDQRQAGQTDAVNESQLRAGLVGVSIEQIAHLTIAYEPVWAIGTGKTASPADAQAAHAHIRRVLASLFGPAAAQAIRIQYGGSVKPDNALAIFSQPDIDGGLIGGASLDAPGWLKIIRAAAESVPGR